AMLMHIYKFLGKSFDYMVGSQIDGFETMVKVTNDAPVIILEGDEYLTSALNPVPKFHIYKPHIAMLTGIAWDHINVFPTFENYVEQFDIFLSHLSKGSPMAYFKGDEHLVKLANKYSDLKTIAYDTHQHVIKNGQTFLLHENKEIPVQIFGEHNLQNLSGVKILANEAGITDEEFYAAISSFGGTARRLEKIYDHSDYTIFRDFAHSPSKVTATTEAVKKQFAYRKLIACFELHTYSSLNKDFLNEYAGALDAADTKVVFYNEHTFEIKKMQPLTHEDIYTFFGKDTLIFHTADELLKYIQSQSHNNTCLLLMSSGSFDGLNLEALKK
ncbi:MAG: peptidoglycan synthetase, partial [Bacteroidetes bacterium]|nr:peptidoglycan synthetase [Bacteroidota bacterium]